MNTFSRIKIKLFICCCLVATTCNFTGCKSAQNSVKGEASSLQTHKITEQILTQQPEFRTAQASKINATVIYGEREISAGGTINIMTDSVILLSIQPLFGIELFRAELTPEYITVVDKMNRRYVRMTYDEINRETGIPLEYATLQAIACNQLFAVGASSEELKSMHTAIQKTDRQYQLNFTEKNIVHRFQADATTYRIGQTTLAISGKTDTLAVRYNDFQITGEVAFPHQIAFEVHATGLSAQCRFTILRLTFNGKVNIQPTDLKKYQQTTIEALLKK